MNFKEVKEKIKTFINDELISLEPWIVNSEWSEKLPKLNELRDKVKEIANSKKPILGICFGHQLLADALGGEVCKNKKGWELGSYAIELTNEGLDSPLFEGILNNEIFYESHQDVVKTLPVNSIALAHSEKGNQSFMLNDNIYGVQFHPEFSWEVTKTLMDIRINKGVEVDNRVLLKSPSGYLVLSNFIDIIERKK